MIHIAFCTDINYLIPTGVAMISICENNCDIDICFHIVVTTSQNVGSDSFSVLREIAQKYGKEYRQYQLSEENLSGYVCSGVSYVTTTAFSRVFLADLLPATVQKVIYLDCDIVCEGRLDLLWNTDLAENNAIIGGVEDFGCYAGYARERLPLRIDDTYINSGVLLIDLLKWREKDIAKKCVDCSIQEKYSFLDQDVINIVCRGNIYNLSFVYNFQIPFWLFEERFWMISGERMEDARQAKGKPIIIHYTENKPWKNPYLEHSRHWIKYYSISPWNEKRTLRAELHDVKYSPYYSKLKNLYWSEFSLMYRTLPVYLSIIQIVHRLRILCSKMKGKS